MPSFCVVEYCIYLIPYPFPVIVYSLTSQCEHPKKKQDQQDDVRLQPEMSIFEESIGFAIRIPTGWYEAWYNSQQESSGH